MFTGIIEGLGRIVDIRSSGQGRRLGIDADFMLDRTRIGDSIAVNGACLTVVSLAGRRFEADVSPETLSVTTLKHARVGDPVNLERALQLSGRIDGHLVSGHVDGTGILYERNRNGNAWILAFEIDRGLIRGLIRKGSVAVDGVSLTVNEIRETSFTVSIIPHTAEVTTIGTRRTGDAVNIETDLIGKYVERFLTNRGGEGVATENRNSGIDMAFLHKSGFM